MDLFKNIKSESMGTHQELLTIKIEKDLFIKQNPIDVYLLWKEEYWALNHQTCRSVSRKDKLL